MPVDSIVEYSERQGSGGYVLEADGNSATRILQCSYAEAGQLATDLRGTIVAGAGGSSQVWLQPKPHPAFPWLFARRIRVEPLGPIAPANPDDCTQAGVTYPMAIVTVDYAPIDFPDPTDPQKPPYDQIIWIEENRRLGAEYLTVDDQNVRFEFGDGEKLNISPTKVLPIQDVSITINQWINAPVPYANSALNLWIGSVNQSVFKALWTPFQAETLLYLGYDASRSYTSDGITAWTVTLQFKWNPSNWNKKWRPENEAFEYVFCNGKKLYERESFNGLLPV